jgi:hypothetical protein
VVATCKGLALSEAWVEVADQTSDCRTGIMGDVDVPSDASTNDHAHGWASRQRRGTSPSNGTKPTKIKPLPRHRTISNESDNAGIKSTRQAADHQVMASTQQKLSTQHKRGQHTFSSYAIVFPCDGVPVEKQGEGKKKEIRLASEDLIGDILDGKGKSIFETTSAYKSTMHRHPLLHDRVDDVTIEHAKMYFVYLCFPVLQLRSCCSLFEF